MNDKKSCWENFPQLGLNQFELVSSTEIMPQRNDSICSHSTSILHSQNPHPLYRFVQLYSGQTISFGKIQKQIKCELLNEKSSVSACLESGEDDNAAAVPQLIVPAIEENPNEDSNMDSSAFSSWDETASSSNYSDALGEQIAEQVEENQEFAGTSNVEDDDDSVELHIDSETSSLSLVQKSPTKLKQESVAQKKPPSKQKVKKVPKLKVPGSAKRLKIKEKAVLRDVFSKYGSKTAFASKDS